MRSTGSSSLRAIRLRMHHAVRSTCGVKCSEVRIALPQRHTIAPPWVADGHDWGLACLASLCARNRSLDARYALAIAVCRSACKGYRRSRPASICSWRSNLRDGIPLSVIPVLLATVRAFVVCTDWRSGQTERLLGLTGHLHGGLARRADHGVLLTRRRPCEDADGATITDRLAHRIQAPGWRSAAPAVRFDRLSQQANFRARSDNSSSETCA